MSTFVSVGNATQPFYRLLEAVRKMVHQVPQPVFFQYGSAQNFRCQSSQAVAFMDMQAFEQQVAEAELLILHAGAGSVMHAVRAGKVPVIMPRRAHFGELVDDHQLEFARELEAAGNVVMCEDAIKLPDSVSKALDRQRYECRTSREPALVEVVRKLLHDYAP